MVKQPGWLRALEIVAGLLAMASAVLVFIFPVWGVVTLVLILSIGLFFLGFRSISLVGHGGSLKSHKVLSAVTGIMTLILALLVIIFPAYGVVTLLMFVSFGIMIYGFGRLFLAYAVKTAAGWIRGLMAMVGIIDVILSILVLLLPGFALLTFAAILSLMLLISGAESIISGIIGHTWLGDTIETVKKEMQ